MGQPAIDRSGGRLPSLFLSHGSPMLALEDSSARHFIAGLGAQLPRPRAILVVSAHWETEVPAVNSVERNTTIHDFRGFPPALYELQYPAPGAPALASRVTELLKSAGMPCAVHPRRGLDHGAWVPLLLMYPQADIPVAQLSVQSHLEPDHHLKLGRALAPLRDEGVLIIGSGSMTHNLSEFRGHGPDDPPQDWVERFAGWFKEKLTSGDTEALVNYRKLAPDAVRNHPTDEHLLPLYVALGAAGEDARAEQIHASSAYAILRMDAYAFETAGEGETRKVA